MSVIPSTAKLVVPVPPPVTPPLITTEPTEDSLVMSASLALMPGSMTRMPNRSRPFKVISENWFGSISFRSVGHDRANRGLAGHVSLVGAHARQHDQNAEQVPSL